MLTPRDRLDYSLRQIGRVGWYVGHYFASQRFREAPASAAPPKPRRKGPGLGAFFEAMGALFATDLANAERGLYPPPRDHEGSLISRLARSRAYFADLPVAAERKAEGRGTEVYSEELAAELPAYFLQNFHYQTGGYLTAESAKLYDMQVEVLFSGTANAMRRQCLVPIAEFMRGKDQRKLNLLDVASGTGRFVRFVKQAFPRLKVMASDLSEAYLDEAREHVKPYGGVSFETAKAEALPFADASFDLITCIYLFHEVPPTVRRQIGQEFARVLKPGGLLVFMDSLQTGDVPVLDATLESFPASFHEPFYESYLAEDLNGIFRETGLEPVSADPIFLSKRIVATRH
jgi:ubiquinone/menaquinone biosynthesis C-methylase UbiE